MEDQLTKSCTEKSKYLSLNNEKPMRYKWKQKKNKAGFVKFDMHIFTHGREDKQHD